MIIDRARLVLAAILFLPIAAHGQGLVIDYGAAARDGGCVTTLAPLNKLTVDASLSDTMATTAEQRTYRPPTHTGCRGLAPSVTFYRPLAHGADVASILVGGDNRVAEVLTAAEADALRVELTLKLRDPVVLRDLGLPMLVVGGIAAPTEGFNPSVELAVTLQQPLMSRGTLKGVSVPTDWHRQPAGSVDVTVTATTDAQLRTLYSPYHTLAVTRGGAHTLTGTYQGWQRCTAFEVTLLIATGDEPVRLDLLPFRYDGDGTFMALLSTPASPPDDTVSPRDIALVIDTSGSMEGEKMQQARDALVSVLGQLQPQDSFSVVAFDGAITPFADTAVAATDANVSQAQAFVEELAADGGTNIYDALKAAFASFASGTGHARYVVFLTDGQATNGETDTDAILAMAASHNEVGARLFTFGIGHDVNTVLLDKLAMASGGDALYVQPGQAVDAAVEQFFGQIADPVLTNPVLDVAEIGGVQLFPAAPGDLFAGQTVAILGRYEQPGAARIRISGEVAGRAVDYTWDVVLPEHAVTEGYVPRVWAKRRVGALLQEIKLGNSDPALVEEVRTLAHRYGVITDFTYFKLNDDGDMLMTYADVPDAETGSAAVGASAAIDSYQKGGTVDGPVDTWIRYLSDRTFPLVSGWFTDTALGPDGDWTELHFGSPAFWALLEADRDVGIAPLLSVGANARFEHLGRQFRVTDPTDSPVEDVPAESVNVPAAATPSPNTQTSATFVPQSEPGARTGSPNVTPAVAPTTISGAPVGCASAGSTAPQPRGLLLLVLGVMCALIRQKRSSSKSSVGPLGG